MRAGFWLLAALISTSAAYSQTVALPQLMDAPKVAECNVTDEWATPAEKACYATTPEYAETMAYLRER